MTPRCFFIFRSVRANFVDVKGMKNVQPRIWTDIMIVVMIRTTEV